MPIPLKKQIEKAQEKNPDLSQRKIATRVGIPATTFNLILNRGYIPRRESSEALQERILEACRELGIAVLDPPEANFEGVRRAKDDPSRLTRAWFLLWDAGIPVTHVAEATGVNRAAARSYILGHIPRKTSHVFEFFQSRFAEYMKKRFPYVSADSLYEVLSLEDWEEEKAKIKSEEEIVMLPRDAQKHYGWKRNPFETGGLRSEEEIYLSDTHRAALEELLEAVQDHRMAVLYGETGSGKTTLKKLLKSLLSRIPAEQVEDFFELKDLREMSRQPESSQGYLVLEPPQDVASRIDAGNLVNFLLAGLGVGRNLKNDKSEKALMLKEALSASKRRVVMFLDEANRIDPDTLRVLKNFNELQDNFRRLLTVVVFGQPIGLRDQIEFNSVLKEIKIRTLQVDLPVLQNGAVLEYLRSRLELVGAEPEKVFEAKALEELLDQADRYTATPATVNNLATAALKRHYDLNPNKPLVSVEDIIRSRKN